MLTLTGVLCASILLISACGSEEAAIDDRPNATFTEFQVPDNLRVIVVSNSEGRLPPDAEIQCGGSPLFPASALDDMPLVADATMEAAMASFLDTGEGSFWPQDGWRLLHDNDERAIVVHLEPGGSTTSMMTLERAGDQWHPGPSQSGPCSLRTALPAGMNTIEWRLDPAAPAPTSDSTAIELLISEVDCVSGQAVGDRLLGPEVVATDGAMLIAFAATSLPGDQTCPANPEQPIVVQLPEPLGDRALVDGLSAIGDLADFIDSEPATPTTSSTSATRTDETDETDGDIASALGEQPGPISRTVSPSWVAEFEDFEDFPSLIESVQAGGDAPELSAAMAAVMAVGLPAGQGIPYYFAAEMANGLVIAEEVSTRLENGDSMSVSWRFRWADTPPGEICIENQVLWDNGWQVWTNTDPNRGMIRYLAEHPTVPLNAEISYFPDPLQWPEAFAEDDPILSTSPQDSEAVAADILDVLAAVIPIPRG